MSRLRVSNATRVRVGTVVRKNRDKSYDSITTRIRATSLTADVRPESVMSSLLPVSVLISDRMDRKEERKGPPSGSIHCSFFGRHFMHYLTLEL